MQNIKAYIMLICASLFWAGNFIVGKYAFLTEIPPLSLVFYRWSLVWIILLPFTYKEIIKYKDTIFGSVGRNLKSFLLQNKLKSLKSDL